MEELHQDPLPQEPAAQEAPAVTPEGQTLPPLAEPALQPEAPKVRKRISTPVLLAGIAVCAVALLFLLTQYTFAGGHFHSVKAENLDLRGTPVTLQEYRSLRRRMPGSRILWDVPFQGGTVSSDITELTLHTLVPEDLEALSCLEDLTVIHAEKCRDYALLVQLQQLLPECDVRYTVSLSGEKLRHDAQEAVLSTLTIQDVQLLTYLPQLKRVSVSGCRDYALLQQVQADYPQWTVHYTVDLGGIHYPYYTEEITVSGASYEEIRTALTGLSQLKRLTLVNPAADGSDLVALKEANSAIDLSWQVNICGVNVPWDVQELDLSGIQVGSCEEVEEKLTSLPNLEKVIMSDCGIDSETMAAFRERQRENYKVVWTVYLGKIAKCRTDDTYFMPIQQGEYYLLDSHTEELKYCEEMVCIDVGHHMIHNIDFVAYMPHLKYLILAHTGVRDLSPIVNCQELVYLEIDWSEVQDYTPLKELKALEDLNIDETFCDIAPILEMTWLKNLWAPNRGHKDRTALEEALPDTHLQLTKSYPAGQGWRNLDNYYAQRDFMGMYYMR